MSRFLLGIGLLVLFATGLPAQDQLLGHPNDSRIWLSGQINLIHQQHPSFFAKYTGENSLQPEREKAIASINPLHRRARFAFR
jgi:hypothetical protein